ncbi:DUF1489 family protein [Novispirillum sp. DQ9]|uniref:DUF1489 family protein n=1 Tax=Novispirillum sp. DQ9 TaxID=3398612 RepID=UPI003C7D31EA
MSGTVHMIKWAAGIDGPDHLKQVHAQRRATFGKVFTRTRMVPKRAEALLDGGSLFWVVKGVVAVRQPILGLEQGTDDEGKAFCDIALGDHVLVSGGPRRPFQGWRYLTPEDAPPDLAAGIDGAAPPPDMAAELRALGLL